MIRPQEEKQPEQKQPEQKQPEPQGEPLVSVQSKGNDVREVLADLFLQAKYNFMLHPAVRGNVYLSLQNKPFSQVLQMICTANHLRWETREGVYHVMPENPPGAAKPALKPETFLKRTVSLQVKQADLPQVTQALQKQAGVPIELDVDVPTYRVHANLSRVTLQTALQALCEGVGLTYRWTGQRFLITRVVGSPPVTSPNPVVTLYSASGLRSAGGGIAARPAPTRNTPPPKPLACPKCKLELQKGWRYCPMCGAWVKPITGQ